MACQLGLAALLSDERCTIGNLNEQVIENSWAV